ncbi:hypothetical protein NIES4071_108310 (plasmid) [Calothrix sp. NIES-4071]|nr:hypothetical protein NIES4071_108310 [Calothrix sp. NIES-4071]BAZ64871.1 hypothetical protein NIES4105_106040 [Calothrix sp. NIES-4105]
MKGQPVLYNARTNDKITLNSVEYLVLDTFPNWIILDYQGTRKKISYEELRTSGAVFSA